ncbi:MAG: serine/threonine protein kinase, partial [Myxococcota bacterium]
MLRNYPMETASNSQDTARQRYKVIRKIDAGGMAEIFIARAQAVGGIEKTVAIKRVLPSLTRNRRFVNMFLDEARLSMVLTHANIVQVFDVGRADDTYYIVMEFVDGANMRRLFQRLAEKNERLPVPIAAFLMMEVCKGLAHAHEQRGEDGEPLGIVHRDISPPNILISKAGEVKITDFGLAKAVTQLEVTDPGIVKGKFSYLSPEAANGKPVDHRADIFAIGILLWEVLANRRLFLGKSDMETVELIRKAEVPSLSLLNKDVTPEFQAIVEKALARDVKQRFHSARDMGNTLAD